MVASARKQIADFWDKVTDEWLAGGDTLREPLPRWYESYRGRGAGQVTRDGFAEPYVGDLTGTPRLVVLGLNPGRFHRELQSREGTFSSNEIRELGSYRAWAAGIRTSARPGSARAGRTATTATGWALHATG